jgi:hypothetical protein
MAIAVLAAFLAIWIFVVVPAERRHHERKLEVLRKQIEKRQASKAEGKPDTEQAPGEGE